MQIALQPLQFTTAGYYAINLQFLAGIFTGIASYEGRKKNLAFRDHSQMMSNKKSIFRPISPLKLYTPSH